ncbi:MAG: SAM-dependent methyltransferase, partial [Propionibacteriaceae bacterium]
MTFNLDVRGRRVLVLSGGVESLAAVTGLLAAGAEVTVRTGEPVTTLLDLAERQLTRIEAEASANGWGLVLDPDSRPAEQPAEAERVGGPGQVVLVGGGPGDPGLITVAGLEAVREADVIVVDRLAPLTVL